MSIELKMRNKTIRRFFRSVVLKGEKRRLKRLLMRYARKDIKATAFRFATQSGNIKAVEYPPALKMAIDRQSTNTP